MTIPTDSLMKYMQGIEEREHFGAIFVRSGPSFFATKAKVDDDMPGIWICNGAYGNPIIIREDEIVAIVEHKALPTK